MRGPTAKRTKEQRKRTHRFFTNEEDFFHGLLSPFYTKRQKNRISRVGDPYPAYAKDSILRRGWVKSVLTASLYYHNTTFWKIYQVLFL